MIKYNLNNINDWYYNTSDIVKVYRNGAVCYYKITNSGGTTSQTPCFAVVDDISQYSDTEFEDVFNNADEKWYKLNNLDEYEEYGVYGEGRNISYYDGKLTIDGDYEYQYSGNSWVSVGEVSGSTIKTVWYDPASSGDNAKFDIGHYWGEGYKMVWRVYIEGTYGGETGSFWSNNNNTTPFEFSFYSNGFYCDCHNPTSTAAPTVNTSDYDYRVMSQNSLRNYTSGQILLVTLTYGAVKVELEETGTIIVNTGTTRTGFNWYDGLYTPIISNGSSKKAHVSNIQIYNANNELVNDLIFVKNNGATGSDEISMYDRVLNVTYNNTTTNTPTYHIVESGSAIYPVYYDEKSDPANNLSFSSMTEAEEYECPWVGMKAIIGDSVYIFSGDSISGYEWASRLPSGYSEVEYVQATGNSCINTNFMPNTNTRVVVDMQLTDTTTSVFPRLFGAGAWNGTNATQVDYESGYLRVGWFGKTDWTITNIATSTDRRVIDLNKNILYVDGVQKASTTFSSSRQATENLGIFTYIDNGEPAGGAVDVVDRFFLGKLYSSQIYDNGTLIRDYVPARRNSDNVYGLYDIVNDVFYYSVTNYPLTGYPLAGPSKPYIQYEYLQGNGTSYIDTGYHPKDNTTIIIENSGRQATSTTSQSGTAWVGGCSTVTSSNAKTKQVGILYPGSGPAGYGGIRFDYRDSIYHNNNNAKIIQRASIKVDSIGGYLDDTKILTFSNGSSTLEPNNCPFAIFTKAIYTESTSAVTYDSAVYDGKVYSVMIYEGDTLVRNYVPAICNGVVGLYETINGIMYGSVNSTPFTVGNS